MNKKSLLLSLLASFMLAGCTTEFYYTPQEGGKYNPFEEEKDEDGDETEEVVTCTYRFYLSYSHTTRYDEALGKDANCPILTLRDVPMFEPLGKCPEDIDSQAELEAIAQRKGWVIDDTFNKWIGFSYNTVCLDENGLWDFTKDTKQVSVINLYGIWVSE